MNIGLRITRSLRLIGAGDGGELSTNTHLLPQRSDLRVVGVTRLSAQAVVVSLERVRITGGGGVGGTGLAVSEGAKVTVRDATITGNHPTMDAGGMAVEQEETQVSLIKTRIASNSGDRAGGIYVNGAQKLTFDRLSRVTENTASAGNGGIQNVAGLVELPSVDNVTGNASSDALNSCGGGGTFAGPGAVGTTTWQRGVQPYDFLGGCLEAAPGDWRSHRGQVETACPCRACQHALLLKLT